MVGEATQLTPEMARIAQEAMIKGPSSRDVRAQEIADALAKQQSADQVLQTAASIPDFENGTSIVDKNTSRKDKDGKTVRDNEEEKAKKSAEKALKYAEELYLKGYENMSYDGKRYVREKVAQDILNHPSYRDFFSGMTISEAKHWSEEKARDLLRDSRYRESVSKLIAEQMSLDKIIEDVVSGLEVEVDNLSSEKLRLEQRKNEIDQTITDLKKELTEYEDIVDKGRGKKQREGVLHKQASDLRAKAKTARETIISLEAERDKSQREVDRLSRKIERKEDKLEDTDNDTRANKLDNEIESSNKQLDRAIERLRRVEKEIAKQRQIAEESERLAESIETNKGKVEEKLRTVETERNQVIEQLNKIGENLIKKQLDLATKKDEKTLRMKQYIKELEGVFGKAANELVESDMTKAAEYLQKRMQEDSAKAINERDKRVTETLSTSFFKEGKWRKDKINTYKSILLSQTSDQEFDLGGNPKRKEVLFLNGAEQSLVQMMKDAGYNDQYIYEQFTKDQSFVDTQSKAIAKSIIAHRFMHGGWTKAEMQSIVESSWGKGLLAEGNQYRDQIMSEINESYAKNSKLFKASEFMKKYGLPFLGIIAALGLLWLIFGSKGGA